MPRVIRAVGYIRPGVGASLHDQQEVVTRAAAERHWRLLEVFQEDDAARPGLDRPKLYRALTRLADGEAHVLVVSSVDRLALSLQDLANLIRWFEAAKGPMLVCVQPEGIAIDTTHDQGRRIASAFAHLGDWERHTASIRVQEALMARRAAGHRISRPAVADEKDLTELVTSMREQGRTLQEIADLLNEHGIPTLRGGAIWRPSSLQAVLGHRRRRATRPQVLPPPSPTAPNRS